MLKQIFAGREELSLPADFAKLYDWAVRYARVSSSRLVETEDAIQEMLLVAIKCRKQSFVYAKQAMRRRYFEMFRRAKMVQSYISPITDGTREPPVFEERKWEAVDIVGKLLRAVSQDQAVVLNHILEGRTIEEIARVERITSRTVYRYILKARRVLTVIVN